MGLLLSLLLAAAPLSAAPKGSNTPPVRLRLSRELARDQSAAQLQQAGLPKALAAEGLVLWQLTRARTRSGERVHAALSLPADGRPYEPGYGEPERRAELDRRLE